MSSDPTLLTNAFLSFMSSEKIYWNRAQRETFLLYLYHNLKYQTRISDTYFKAETN